MEIIVLEVVLVYVVNVAARWFPWRVIPSWTRDGLLRREIAYLYGTGSIVLGFAAWALSQIAIPGVVAALVLVINAIAAGLAVCTTRLIDALVELRARQLDGEDYEQAIQARE